MPPTLKRAELTELARELGPTLAVPAYLGPGLTPVLSAVLRTDTEGYTVYKLALEFVDEHEQVRERHYVASYPLRVSADCLADGMALAQYWRIPLRTATPDLGWQFILLAPETASSDDTLIDDVGAQPNNGM